MGHEEPEHIHTACERQGADPRARGRPDDKLRKFTKTKTSPLITLMKKHSAVRNQPSAKTFSPQRTQRTQRRTGAYRGSTRMNADQNLEKTQQPKTSPLITLIYY